MNNNTYLARFDALYWRMRRKADKAGLFRQEHYKGAYKGKLSLYGKHSEAERVRLSGRR